MNCTQSSRPDMETLSPCPFFLCSCWRGVGLSSLTLFVWKGVVLVVLLDRAAFAGQGDPGGTQSSLSALCVRHYLIAADLLDRSEAPDRARQMGARVPPVEATSGKEHSSQSPALPVSAAHEPGKQRTVDGRRQPVAGR